MKAISLAEKSLDSFPDQANEEKTRPGHETISQSDEAARDVKARPQLFKSKIRL